MCTTIGSSTPVHGSGKGAQGWFPLDRVWLSYDHPFHAPVEHAVSIDFVNEANAARPRVAVELSRESARELATQLLAIVEQADAYEA
jgi:Family of unknown function (DUF6295)